MDAGKPGRFRFNDSFFGNPTIDKSAIVSESAIIIGQISIGPRVTILPDTVIRIDEVKDVYLNDENYGGVRISEGVNFQDHTLVHAHGGLFVDGDDGKKYCVWVGKHCSVAHKATIHGPAYLGKKCFIGFNVIVHHSTIGRNCMLDHGAVVKKATVGDYCHIGINAVVANVRIDNHRLVPDGWVVNNQETADRLPHVPRDIAEADNDLNKSVVDENKQLCALYKRRQHDLEHHKAVNMAKNLTPEEQFDMALRCMKEMAMALNKTIEVR
ncbi:MAG: hypothetical protein WCG01_00885 [bacterium]